MWQQRAGLGNSPRTILEELRAFNPTTSSCSMTRRGQICLRSVTQPDPAQAALLDRLGIVLPKRMRARQKPVPTLARHRLNPNTTKM